MSCWCKDYVVISGTERKEKVCESFSDIWWRDQSLSFVHMYGVHVQCNTCMCFNSSFLVEGVCLFWLCRIRFLKLFKVLMVQMEFAKKLMAKPGGEYPLRMLGEYNIIHKLLFVRNFSNLVGRASCSSMRKKEQLIQPSKLLSWWLSW